ncbi:hypothetical protein EV127DRAFT_105999 [Xylaria flabelliformis]|nr:hypothetical protein EV127DRAFT_105999 [Xylaria flabelliformis]
MLNARFSLSFRIFEILLVLAIQLIAYLSPVRIPIGQVGAGTKMCLPLNQPTTKAVLQVGLRLFEIRLKRCTVRANAQCNRNSKGVSSSLMNSAL